MFLQSDRQALSHSECISPRIRSEWVISPRQLSCPSPGSCWWSRGSLTSLQGFSCPMPLKLPRTCSSSSWWQEPQLGVKVWVHLEPTCWLCVPLLSKTGEAGGKLGWSLHWITVWFCSLPLVSKCAHLTRSGGEWWKSWGENVTLPSLYVQLGSSFFSSAFLAPHLSLCCRTSGRRPTPNWGLGSAPCPTHQQCHWTEAVVTGCHVLVMQHEKGLAIFAAW